MSVVVHFSRDLSAWLVENLNRGAPPGALVRTMIEERMQPRVAGAIVEAFLSARSGERPLPVDSVVLDDDATEYVYEPSLLRPGSRIEAGDRVVRVLARAEKPTVAVLAGVLAPDECRELIGLARPRLKPSTVVDPASGRDVVADHRSSLGMFFRLGESPFLDILDRRASALMNLPVDNGEGFQVLFYPEGALCSPHFDFLVPSNPANRASIARSGQRKSSLVIYLNDVEKGGETTFPAAGWSISPSLGNAVYFEYANSRGQVDHQSLHGGNPVLAGEKWVATKWMRTQRFVPRGEDGSEGMIAY